jgi:NodT family efflux transporter outer membrane factor (OMF) lipoprotein
MRRASSAIPVLMMSGAALAALLSGCAVGPNFRAPTPPPVDAYAPSPTAATPETAGAGGGAEHFAPGADLQADWWTLFGSKPLEALVRRALIANPDLAAAEAALRQARETAAVDRAALLPSLSLDLSTTRAKNPQVLASPVASNASLYTLNTGQLSFGYTVDVFGGLRRQAESSAALAEAQRFQTEAVRLTLTSNLVLAAITEASVRAQVAATERIVRADQRLLDITRQRQALGDAARADVSAQEAALAQAVQSLPPLRKQLAQQRHVIAILTGQYPGEATDVDFDLDQLTLPQTLPLSLPGALVRQRPDVRAAEADLHAAGAQVGVAIAARLPNLTLTGAYGAEHNQLTRLFDYDNSLWSITGGLTQPLFEGGALRHRQRAAQAAYDEAKAQYRSTVLSACQNVADAIAALQADADGLRAAAASERAAGESLKIAEDQVRLGAISTAQILTVEQTYRQAVVVLAQAQAARFSDTVALFQALGGGWWNRTN